MQVSCIKTLVQIHASVLCRVGLRSIQCKKPVPEKKLESMTHAQKKLKFLVQVSGTRFFYKQRRSATIRELVTFSGRAPSDSKSSFFWLMGPPYQWAPVTRRWSNPIVTPLSNIYKLYRISQWSACLNFIGCHTAEKQLDAASGSKDRPVASAGYLCNLMTEATSSSLTAHGIATVRASATRQGTSGSETSTFITWLKFSTKVYNLWSIVIRNTNCIFDHGGP